jgi:predicted dehydrogenase
MKNGINRRVFISSISMLAAGSLLAAPIKTFGLSRKLRVCLVGTGIRGVSFWGKRLVNEYPDLLEFVGLCDINPGRLELAKQYMGVSCPTYLNFEAMVSAAKPDLIIVTTTDATHHAFIIKGLEMGCDVLTEKPLTTDEVKCQAILDAERKSRKQLIVGFNYRWAPYMTKVKELLVNNAIGKVTSVDFHWYLNTYHGADYFRRWHGQRETSGTLWVHKATHHFDLLNWWLDADPMEVFAYGSLEHYGSNGPFRGKNCRTCSHKSDCKFYWDITKEAEMMSLYVKNEQHDGYIRDNCVFREEINIYDKMSAQIKYANNVVVNYSLTTYSPFEGWHVAFNGMEGRIEAWLDIPHFEQGELSQAELHAKEMSQSGNGNMDFKPIILHKNWQNHEVVQVGFDRTGHGGGDEALQDKLFKQPNGPDPLAHAAGIRDGAMSILIGIAARKSIDTGQPVQIAGLTDLVPRAKRL